MSLNSIEFTIGSGSPAHLQEESNHDRRGFPGNESIRPTESYVFFPVVSGWQTFGSGFPEAPEANENNSAYAQLLRSELLGIREEKGE